MKNYKSLRENQSIDFELTSKSVAQEGFGLTREYSKFPVSPVAGVFGANASGKTNLIEAMSFFAHIVSDGSVSGYEDKVRFSTYMFDKHSKESPIEFFSVFGVDKNIYEYTLILNKERVLFEKLSIVINSKGENNKFFDIFKREFLGGGYQWNWGIGTPTKYEIPKMHRKLADNLDDKRLFFSFYSLSFDNEELKELSRLILSLKMVPLKEDGGKDDIPLARKNFLLRELKYKSFRKAVTGFLSLFEPSIVDIKSVNEEIMVVLKVNDNEYDMPLYLESQGIRQMFRLSAIILNTFRRGTVLVIDELDAHLHHLISKKIIMMFQDSELNKNGAQLVFTSHDLNLLDNLIFCREQIYLAEKNKSAVTSITSLIEIEDIRQRDPFLKKYLSGRMLGLPVLKSDKLFREDVQDSLSVFEYHVIERIS
ncbi:ATP-binding protein [Halobacteriovorax sp. RZ-1]|uniref:AAA family ATPase n=1 Tax=unclassified Halobacteriovorax TaxID=2639665 RepID=UPI00371031AB